MLSSSASSSSPLQRPRVSVLSPPAQSSHSSPASVEHLDPLKQRESSSQSRESSQVPSKVSLVRDLLERVVVRVLVLLPVADGARLRALLAPSIAAIRGIMRQLAPARRHGRRDVVRGGAAQEAGKRVRGGQREAQDEEVHRENREMCLRARSSVVAPGPRGLCFLARASKNSRLGGPRVLLRLATGHATQRRPRSRDLFATFLSSFMS